MTRTLAEHHDLIGHTLGQSDWLTVDQNMIDQFAVVTKDDQFIHTDPVRAADTQFGGTIAHGYLSLSLLTYLCNQAAPVPIDAQVQINYGLNKVRFLRPVLAGNQVRATVSLVGITRKPSGQSLFESKVEVMTKAPDQMDGKPALIATVLALYA